MAELTYVELPVERINQAVVEEINLCREFSGRAEYLIDKLPALIGEPHIAANVP